MTTLYHIRVKTSDDDGSGTNDDIFLTLYGPNNKVTDEVKLDTPGFDDFERGEADSYPFYDTTIQNIGLPEMLKIRKHGDSSDWRVDWIRVEYMPDEPSSIQTAEFNFNGLRLAEGETVPLLRSSPPIVREHVVLKETDTETVIHKRYGVTDNRLGLLPLDEEKSTVLTVTRNLTYSNSKRGGESQSFKMGAKLDIKSILELNTEITNEINTEVENTYAVSNEFSYTASHTVRVSVPPGALTLYEIEYEQIRYKGVITRGEDVELTYSLDGPPTFNTVTRKWDVLPGEIILPEIKRKMDELHLAYHKVQAFAHVRTTRGDHLQVRSAPGVNQKIVYKLNTGEQVLIVDDNPQYADGFLWWNISVETLGDVRGWCIEAFKENNDWYYSLLPSGSLDKPRA